MKESKKCVICEVNLKDEKKLQPLLVSFPHGTLLPEEASRLSCTVCRNKSSNKRHAALATEENNVYVGSVDSLAEGSNASNACNTFIAIRNRKTNKIRFIESENIILSRLEAEPEVFPTKKIVLDDEVTIEDQRSNLHKHFGSKIKQMLTVQSERYRTDIGTLKDDLTEIVEKVDITKFSNNTSWMTIGSNLPPCNRSAASVYEVYQLDDIISKTELDSMAQEASKVLDNVANLETSDYTPFFLKSLPQVMEGRNTLQTVEVLLYVDCILKFFSKPFNNKNLVQACPFSKIIVEKLRRDFTVESTSKRLRPPSIREKGICYVIILGLLVLQFKLDLQLIVDSGITTVGIKRLRELSRAVGATPLSGFGETSVVLRLPLATLSTYLKGSR